MQMCNRSVFYCDIDLPFSVCYVLKRIVSGIIQVNVHSFFSITFDSSTFMGDVILCGGKPIFLVCGVLFFLFVLRVLKNKILLCIYVQSDPGEYYKIDTLY